MTLLFDVISYIETDSSGLPSCFLKPKPNYNKNLDEKFYLLYQVRLEYERSVSTYFLRQTSSPKRATVSLACFILS